MESLQDTLRIDWGEMCRVDMHGKKGDCEGDFKECTLFCVWYSLCTLLTLFAWCVLRVCTGCRVVSCTYMVMMLV